MSATTVSIKNKIYNFKYNLSLLPYEIDLSIRANRYARKKRKEEKVSKCTEEKVSKCTEEKETKKTKKEEKKQTSEAFKEAEKEFGGSFSKQQTEDIINKSGTDNLGKVKLLAKAMETNKWLQFALYYMTNENAILVKADEAEKELVNGIAKYFNFGKIYESAEIADLEVYDMSCEDKYIPVPKFIISISGDIIPRTKDDLIMQKIANRKEQLSAEKEFPQDDAPDEEFIKPSFVTDEDGVIHPVFFTDIVITEDKPVKGEGISDELFNRMETSLVPLIGENKHRYEVYGDLISLFISRPNGIEEQYIIDPGVVMGKDKLYILANVPGDTLFVSIEHVDIVKNVLGNKFYILNPVEIQEVIQDYFRNLNIYRYIDMNKTSFLKDLDTESFQKLGKKLTFIISQIQSQSNPDQQLPRFRFNSWESVDKFMIISDPDVKSPLKMTGETSPVIMEGLMFIVEGDKVTQKLRDAIVEFHIDKYGDM